MSREKDFGIDEFNKSLLSGNSDMLLPHANLITKKKPDGNGYSIHSKDCTGVAEVVPNQKVRRCADCRALSKVGRQAISRSHSPVFEPPHPCTRIDYIANDPTAADHEIRHLRALVKQLKRKKADAILQQELKRNAIMIPPTRVVPVMEAVLIITKELENQLSGEGKSEEEENQMIMWKSQLLHLLRVFKNGGQTRGIPVIPDMLTWSIEFLARTSVKTYEEARKLMKLPHISYVYKCSAKIISTANERAFSLCLQTISSISLRADREEWDDNARIGFLALDSAGTSSGVQWDYRLHKMTGQCNAHKFEPLTNKFNMMANQLKEDRLKEKELEEGEHQEEDFVSDAFC